MRTPYIWNRNDFVTTLLFTVSSIVSAKGVRYSNSVVQQVGTSINTRFETGGELNVVNLEPDASKSDNFLSRSRQFEYVTVALCIVLAEYLLFSIRILCSFHRKQYNQDSSLSAK